jgi:enolase
VSGSPVAALDALEILDSRGRPTVKATVTLASGLSGTASVPSGASTGRFEAHELRDGDPARHRGLGCRRAVASVRGELARWARANTPVEQEALDAGMRALDGTPTLERLGANAVLAVSLAFARARAAERDVPLWRYVADLADVEPALPLPMINLFSGGKHAGGQVDVQDVQVMPLCADSTSDALAVVADVFVAAVELVRERYDMRMLRADEGGLAPPFSDTEEMLACAVDAIAASGRERVALTVDVAASHFWFGGTYRIDGVALDAAGLTERIAGWVSRFPIVSVEDGLAEEDWDGWPRLAAALAGRAMVVGDDLLCTNVARIMRAVATNAADTLLLKANQVGTLTDAVAANAAARTAGWRVVVSARSGETEDDWLADLAVGLGAEHIKVGSITQSERLAKYNRLLEIEHISGLPSPRAFALRSPT